MKRIYLAFDLVQRTTLCTFWSKSQALVGGREARKGVVLGLGLLASLGGTGERSGSWVCQKLSSYVRKRVGMPDFPLSCCKVGAVMRVGVLGWP